MHKLLSGVTAFIYIATLIMSLIWITMTYIFAGYATFKLGQPLPVEELSSQALIATVGVVVAKTVANIFEHNNGGIFGTSDNMNEVDNVVEGGDTENGCNEN